MPRLLLLRHGSTEYNVAHRFQGQTDVPLNDEGRAQALTTAERLRAEPITEVWASDLVRATETARIVARPHGLDVRSDPRLRELGFGLWEGLTSTQIRERYPEAWCGWTTNPVTSAPPEGEALDVLEERIAGVLSDLSERPDKETILVVAHGGSLRWFLCLALGVDTRRHWQFRFDSLAVSELYLYGDKAILTLLNDRSHLSGNGRDG